MTATPTRLLRAVVLGGVLLGATSWGAPEADAQRPYTWRIINGRRTRVYHPIPRSRIADWDRDGIPNGRDLDRDNDGIRNSRDRNDYSPVVLRRSRVRPRLPVTRFPRSTRGDWDRDGIPNFRDRDDDNDGITDRRDTRPFSFPTGRRLDRVRRDSDRDGIPDYRDRDRDGDGVSNRRDRYPRNRRRR